MWFQHKTFRSSFRRFSSVASTIFALSSGQGKCGVAVIRVSGPNSKDAVLQMTNLKELPKPRMALLQPIRNPISKEILDRGLVLWFPGPKSFTGEDSCEFQIHGGPAVIASVLSALSRIKNFAPAEPGEFTKRAFHAGKLDLTEVEGLGDLIHAETELQRKQALIQMEGTLSKLYNSWRQILLKNVAHLEAYIDFSEDENIEEDIMDQVKNNLLQLNNDIHNHLKDGRRGERLRGGVNAIIVGEPNAGKSSLLNLLCQKPAAIVTPIPGTTRDVIELHININGYPLILTDTAGLRSETHDVVEKEGISRAHAAIKLADLIILVVDANKCLIKSGGFFTKPKMNHFLNEHINNLGLTELNLKGLENENVGSSIRHLYVLNKTDLLPKDQRLNLENLCQNDSHMKCLSCITEDGISSFIEALSKHLEFLCGNPSRENPSLTQARHRHHLTECSGCIKQCLELTTHDQTPIAAHHLRKGLRHLSKITGHVSTEEILDVIFKDFCIGK